MVQLMNSEIHGMKKVKLETEDSGEDGLRPLHKRPKFSSPREVRIFAGFDFDSETYRSVTSVLEI